VYPVLFEVFGFPVFSFTVALLVGVFGALFVAYNLLKKRGFKAEILFDKIIFLFLFSLIFGRIFHLFIDMGDYHDSFWQMFNIFDGKGFTWGILIGIYLFINLILIKDTSNKRGWYDVLTPSWLFAMFFYYFGGFLAQKNIGIPTDQPWGVIFEGPDFPFSGVTIHPVDGYMALTCLILFIFSFIFVFKKKTLISKGGIFFLSLLIYSILGLVAKKYAMSAKHIVSGYDIENLISWTLIVISFILLSIEIYKKYVIKFIKKSNIPNSTRRRNKRRSTK
jgi:prolipoprotein diacylglyceryltransferase